MIPVRIIRERKLQERPAVHGYNNMIIYYNMYYTYFYFFDLFELTTGGSSTDIGTCDIIICDIKRWVGIEY